MCHRYHYLQMATEKLSKAFLCPSNYDTPLRTHKTLGRFLRTLSNLREYREQLGFKNYAAAFRVSIHSILDVADYIESLAPAVNEDLYPESTEYPSADHQGLIVSPVSFEFDSFPKEELIKFSRLIHDLLRIAT